MNFNGMYENIVRDDEANGIFTVSRLAYHDQDIYRHEMAAVFGKCWLYVGHESELPDANSFITRRIANKPILFIRDIDGIVRALLNVCPHRGAMVCRETRGKAKSFECMYHGWVFRNNGNLIHHPGSDRYKDTVNTDGRLNLPAVPRLESYRDFYFINFDPQAVDLVTYLGNAREYIDLVVDQAKEKMRIVPGTQEYYIHANWKLLAENSVDIYHGNALHPTYISYLKNTTGAVAPMQGTGGIARDLGNGHGVVEYKGPWGRPIANWIPMWGEDGKAEIDAIYQNLVARHGPERAERIAKKSRNLLIFPNFVINDIGAVTVRTFQPTASGAMLANSWALAPVEESPKFLARRLDNYLEFLGPAGFATPDDVEAMESCQRGYADVAGAEWSDLSKGFGCGDQDWEDEGQMRSFWRRWHALMLDGVAGERA